MQWAEKNGKVLSNALYVLREERELISGEDMVDYITNYPHCQHINGDQLKDFNASSTIPTPLQFHRKNNVEKKRQLRNMWTDEEHKKFEAALSEHGPKRLKEISNAIGTRSVS